ncbi:MAG: DUF1343 domain-containing protein [bacterium]|nr:DUF1343 domain-containing protein [bacterium]MDY2650910.1 DUF1343 domain-containing protein [Candidatus Egerieousia sp.]
MIRITRLAAVVALLSIYGIASAQDNNRIESFPGEEQIVYATDIITGAQSVNEYLPLLKGKRVALLSNHTGMVTEKRHVVDTLVSSGVNVVCIMSPEHGFRGSADAGEHVSSSVDEKTGIEIISLYGVKHKNEDLTKRFDVMVFDLQDVGVRFYTYYITMTKMMEACAEAGKEFIVLDRPNPIGYLTDGPILDMKYKSGVGYLPIPTAHGMTLGELALMINGEKWLKDGIQCKLTVIKCKNYNHKKLYRLPLKPSPNLPDMRSVYLYPSTCYFEQTPLSLGRGTDKPFQVYGHPNIKDKEFTFTPVPNYGAKDPRYKNQVCYGVDLRMEPSIAQIMEDGINFSYIIDAYKSMNLDRNYFFGSGFELETGQLWIRNMIKEGKSAAEIKAAWAKDVEAFKKQREPYMLYE